jgi:hypothetical protein
MKTEGDVERGALIKLDDIRTQRARQRSHEKREEILKGFKFREDKNDDQ